MSWEIRNRVWLALLKFLNQTHNISKVCLYCTKISPLNIAPVILNLVEKQLTYRLCKLLSRITAFSSEKTRKTSHLGWPPPTEQALCFHSATDDWWWLRNTSLSSPEQLYSHSHQWHQCFSNCSQRWDRPEQLQAHISRYHLRFSLGSSGWGPAIFNKFPSDAEASV